MAVASHLRIELGWPAKALWPNGGRGHHMAHWRASKAAKEEANWTTRATLGRNKFDHDGGQIAIHVIGHPQTAHPVDKQNLVSGLKYHFDGIAQALGVDDKHFDAPTVEWAEPVKGGKIVIEVGA